MTSKLFSGDAYEAVATRIKDFLNSQEEFLSGSTVKSTRAAGDAMEDILSKNFEALLGPEHCSKYTSGFERRAMADFAFEDNDGANHFVDVKTHRRSTKFNMPNLTSVDRLADFYVYDSNYFVLLLIAYDIDGLKANIESVSFVPIEFLDWSCLRIGALGKGQIQIANSKNIVVNPQYSRKKWMIELCETLLSFYPKEIKKIEGRIEQFQQLKKQWESSPD